MFFRSGVPEKCGTNMKPEVFLQDIAVLQTSRKAATQQHRIGIIHYGDELPDSKQLIDAFNDTTCRY